jgi:hypothetical protein
MQETAMRRIALAVLAASVGALVSYAAAPAQAQTFSPNFPVCLRVYGLINYYDCSYLTLPECNATASARAAQCLLNPYFANADYDRPLRKRHGRRHYVY